MAITPRLEIRQSQSLLMTTQLRQAINLLQMSNVELSELIETELSQNPLLEREEDISEKEIEKKEQSETEEPIETIEDYGLDVDYDNEFDDFGSDRESYDNNGDYAFEDYSKTRQANISEDFDFFEDKLSHIKSLYDFLKEQIYLAFKKNYDKIIALRLCEFLDDSGYFIGNTKKISSSLNIEEEKTLNILSKLKEFEPSGIFASSLAECLKTQLKDKNLFNEKIEILLNNLDLLANGNFAKIKNICKISTDEELASIIKNIKAQNPKPANKFFTENTQYIIPDILVRTNKNGDYIIELNPASLPRVLINQSYVSEISKLYNKEANKYIKKQLSSASFLVKALHQRATTILRVSEEIITRQKDFFKQGVKHLRPMLLRDIAEAIEMHESTISRVTTNKFMMTPRGLFELKYFFSSAAGSYSNDDTTSIISIKHKIKDIIDNESKSKILSDDKIVEMLASEEIKIARRTIAKYRDSMNIPSSSIRKKTKNQPTLNS